MYSTSLFCLLLLCISAAELKAQYKSRHTAWMNCFKKSSEKPLQINSIDSDKNGKAFANNVAESRNSFFAELRAGTLFRFSDYFRGGAGAGVGLMWNKLNIIAVNATVYHSPAVQLEYIHRRIDTANIPEYASATYSFSEKMQQYTVSYYRILGKADSRSRIHLYTGIGAAVFNHRITGEVQTSSDLLLYRKYYDTGVMNKVAVNAHVSIGAHALLKRGRLFGELAVSGPLNNSQKGITPYNTHVLMFGGNLGYSFFICR